jgi:hypothetical protein
VKFKQTEGDTSSNGRIGSLYQRNRIRLLEHSKKHAEILTEATATLSWTTVSEYRLLESKVWI